MPAPKPKPKPNNTSRSSLINVRLPLDLVQHLREIRDTQGTPVTQSINLAVRHWLMIRKANADAVFVVEYKGGTVSLEQAKAQAAKHGQGGQAPSAVERVQATSTKAKRNRS